MKKSVRPVIAILFLAITGNVSLYTQSPSPSSIKPRVAVQAPLPGSEDVQLTAISRVVRETLVYILESLNRYELVLLNRIPDDSMKEVCIRENIDHLISGETYYEEDNLILRLFVFDRQTDNITEEVIRSTETVLEIFSLVDKMAIELLEGFSGIPIAYGSIEFEINGFEAEFRVYIDGKQAVLQSGAVVSVLAGEHELVITQERMFGETIVDGGPIRIRENESTVWELTLPDITAEELTQIMEAETFISKNRNKFKNEAEVERKYREILTLLENTDYSPEAVRWKEYFENGMSAWVSYRDDRRIRRSRHRIPDLLLPENRETQSLWNSVWNPALSAMLESGMIHAGYILDPGGTPNSVSDPENPGEDPYLTIEKSYSMFNMGLFLPRPDNYGINAEMTYLKPREKTESQSGDQSVSQTFLGLTGGLSKRNSNYAWGGNLTLFRSGAEGDPADNGFAVNPGLAGIFQNNTLYMDAGLTFLSLPRYYYDFDEDSYVEGRHPVFLTSNQNKSFSRGTFILKNSFRLDFYRDTEASGRFLRIFPVLEYRPFKNFALSAGVQYSSFDVDGTKTSGWGALWGYSLDLENFHADFSFFGGENPVDMAEGATLGTMKFRLSLLWDNIDL